MAAAAAAATHYLLNATMMPSIACFVHKLIHFFFSHSLCSLVLLSFFFPNTLTISSPFNANRENFYQYFCIKLMRLLGRAPQCTSHNAQPILHIIMYADQFFFVGFLINCEQRTKKTKHKEHFEQINERKQKNCLLIKFLFPPCYVFRCGVCTFWVCYLLLYTIDRLLHCSQMCALCKCIEAIYRSPPFFFVFSTIDIFAVSHYWMHIYKYKHKQ